MWLRLHDFILSNNSMVNETSSHEIWSHDMQLVKDELHRRCTSVLASDTASYLIFLTSSRSEIFINSSFETLTWLFDVMIDLCRYFALEKPRFGWSIVKEPRGWLNKFYSEQASLTKSRDYVEDSKKFKKSRNEHKNSKLKCVKYLTTKWWNCQLLF
jgi:hypothetical protein